MPINPITFANKVNDQFLNYQLTAFPLTDPDLAQQARELLRSGPGPSPLFKGPYVSLSKSFKRSRDLRQLAEEGAVHPALPGLTDYTTLFEHQWQTLKAVNEEQHCLIATGTGSGKTEAFLYPILNHCLHLRDQDAPEGVTAILVYPMNALANDQLERLRGMLAGSGISFGMYIGPTPSTTGELRQQLHRMQADEDRAAYRRYKSQYEQDKQDVIVSPYEERLTERQMADHLPRILLTNVHQLEYLLTRGKDLGMFIDAPLKYLVFDEAHTYTGVRGAEVSCLIRRLRGFCGRSADEVICIGTSATVADIERNEEAEQEIRAFAHRFFGINPDQVVLVQEEYEDETFPEERYMPSPPEVDAGDLLEETLQALESRSESAVRTVVRRLTGQNLSTMSAWPSTLYDHFKSNEYVYALYQRLARPADFVEATQDILMQLNRGHQVTPQDQAELLCYLALGAAAEQEEQPLLRPQVHYFVKGLEGAVMAFARENGEACQPDLFLSRREAVDTHNYLPEACPPVLVCKTCGQHYLETYYRDFHLDKNDPVGGTIQGDTAIWEPADETTGNRVLLTNRFISEVDDETDIRRIERKRFAIYFCRYCGTLHLDPGTCRHPKCGRPGDLVQVWGIHLEQGQLKSCVSCNTTGGRVGGRRREPIRPLRAITVADVHILAQNMLNAMEQPDQRNLIVFSDNRQDAAFQAGWMKDRARRYRLRHLIYDYLRNQQEPVGIGDVVSYLYQTFRKEPALARALAPEVYEAQSYDYFGSSLKDTLTKFLRITLLRELTTSYKQRDSLENWGVMRVQYYGVHADHPWMQGKAEEYGLDTQEFVDGISTLLDSFRRSRLLYDQEEPIFSQWWHESEEEIQHGFLPLYDFPPQGLKKYRGADDKDTYVRGFLSDRGQTLAQDYISKWGIGEDAVFPFLESIWEFLTAEEQSLLPTVTLRSSRGQSVTGAIGVRQLDSRVLGMQTQRERYRCNICRRIHTRPAPGMACSGYRCKGTLIQDEPPDDDYNLAMLELPFTMVRAEEHSGQVPGEVRKDLEDAFKQVGGEVNCLVSTPTLELGVDIGDLDMILMRNVPPKPSNYWQRAGRAGRRHRMAVIYTYARRSDHDRYFFEQPDRMLDGRIETPQFNLRNEIMIRKHVHSAVISELIRLSRYDENDLLTDDERMELKETYHEVFPDYIATYLFREGRRYRTHPYEVGRLHGVLERHADIFAEAVIRAFHAYWPDQDTALVTPEAIRQYLMEMLEHLQRVINRMHRRLMWAVHTQARLLHTQEEGILESEEEALLRRCKRYIKDLSTQNLPNYTLNALAGEGFLPGYGLYEHDIRAFAKQAATAAEGKDVFELNRSAGIALREFVPGNMIYANSARFKVALYHLPIGSARVEPVEFSVDMEHERVRDRKDRQDLARYGDVTETAIPGIPIADLDISYIARISDEEDYRFQMPVTLLGYTKSEHRGIRVYKIAGREVQHRFGQATRLVNVGPADLAAQGTLGYPVCTVCGGTRSPYASQSELEHFWEIHSERHNITPQRIMFYSDTQVDGLFLHGLDSKEEAINLGEALRVGAARVLEMDVEDLQILVLSREDESYATFLYDPMPGGSGLLQQMIDKWSDVMTASKDILTGCPGRCEASCYECLRTYRNVYYHQQLNRFQALDLIEQYEGTPHFEYETDPIVDLMTVSEETATYKGEKDLNELLMEAGFPQFAHEKTLQIGKPFERTRPDLYYEDPSGAPKLAIYLDGLSKGIHGDPDTHLKDQMIRMQLESQGIDVIEIARSDLDDPEAMRLHYKRIAYKLSDNNLVDKFTE